MSLGERDREEFLLAERLLHPSLFIHFLISPPPFISLSPLILLSLLLLSSLSFHLSLSLFSLPLFFKPSDSFLFVSSSPPLFGHLSCPPSALVLILTEAQWESVSHANISVVRVSESHHANISYVRSAVEMAFTFKTETNHQSSLVWRTVIYEYHHMCTTIHQSTYIYIVMLIYIYSLIW